MLKANWKLKIVWLDTLPMLPSFNQIVDSYELQYHDKYEYLLKLQYYMYNNSLLLTSIFFIYDLLLATLDKKSHYSSYKNLQDDAQKFKYHNFFSHHNVHIQCSNRPLFLLKKLSTPYKKKKKLALYGWSLLEEF